MNKHQPDAAISSTEQAENPVVYKAYEFARSSSAEDFVLVLESRTYFYLDGSTRQEVELMETPFEQMVRAFNGDFRKSAKRLTGLFDAPDQAKGCARKIANLYDKPVEISGNQITLVL